MGGGKIGSREKIKCMRKVGGMGIGRGKKKGEEEYAALSEPFLAG